MLIETRDFGQMEVLEADKIYFVEPIYGFEEYRRFVLLCENEMPGFFWLQSMDEPALCFILVEPQVVQENYAPTLPVAEISQKLGQGKTNLLLMTVIRDNVKDSTVNLRSPVVLNPKTQNGMQVILEESLPIRYPLAGEGANA